MLWLGHSTQLCSHGCAIRGSYYGPELIGSQPARICHRNHIANPAQSVPKAHRPRAVLVPNQTRVRSERVSPARRDTNATVSNMAKVTVPTSNHKDHTALAVSVLTEVNQLDSGDLG